MSHAKVTQKQLAAAHKPFDIVTDIEGNVGMITETNINECQSPAMIGYSVEWLIGDQTKVAWWGHEDLKVHRNIMIVIAEEMTSPHGSSRRHVAKLLGGS